MARNNYTFEKRQKELAKKKKKEEKMQRKLEKRKKDPVASVQGESIKLSPSANEIQEIDCHNPER